MPFNADTYHANAYRRRARENLDEARNLKTQGAAGGLRPWQDSAWLDERVRLYVRLARSANHLANIHRRSAALTKASRR